MAANTGMDKDMVMDMVMVMVMDLKLILLTIRMIVFWIKKVFLIAYQAYSKIMEVKKTKINGVFLIKPQIFKDKRGYFFESFNSIEFRKAIGLDVQFVQDNQSLSSKNVLRGLHFQHPPFAQAKLVSVIKGEVLDVVVDIRKGSDT